MALEKAPLESVNILPTACKLLSSLNANALASLSEVGVLYIEKTISGNLKAFHLDENQQKILLQISAKSISNNGRFKSLLQTLEDTMAATPLSPEDSAEFIKLAFELRRAPIELQFYLEGEISVVKRTEQGEIPEPVREKLSSDEDGSSDMSYLERKVSKAGIKFEPIENTKQNSTNFWDYIQKNLKRIRKGYDCDNVYKFKTGISLEQSNLAEISQQIDALRQRLDTEVMQLDVKEDETLLKQRIDSICKDVAEGIMKKKRALSNIEKLTRLTDEIYAREKGKEIVGFLNSVEFLFKENISIVNGLNKGIFAGVLDTFDLEALLDLRMVLMKLHTLYVDLKEELRSSNYIIIPSLEADVYALTEKTIEINAAISEHIKALEQDVAVNAQKEIAKEKEIVSEKEYCLNFSARAYLARYRRSLNSTFEKLYLCYQGEVISLSEFVFLCQLLGKNKEFVENVIDSSKKSAVQNAENEKMLGDELLCFIRFAIIAEETYLFVRAQPAISHEFIAAIISNFNCLDKESLDSFLRDLVSLFKDGYITIKDVEQCAAKPDEKIRLMKGVIEKVKIKREQTLELSYHDACLHNQLMKTKHYILEQTNEKFELNITPADLTNGTNLEESKKQPQFSFPAFFPFIKVTSSFQAKAGLFLQSIFRAKNFEEVKAILGETAKANPEDDTFFGPLIKQIYQFQAISLEPAENKAAPSNIMPRRPVI